MLHGVSNIGKLAVLEYHKVMLLGKAYQLRREVLVKVLDNVNVGL